MIQDGHNQLLAKAQAGVTHLKLGRILTNGAVRTDSGVIRKGHGKNLLLMGVIKTLGPLLDQREQ